MASDKATFAFNFVDMLVKTLVGAAVALGGFFGVEMYRDVKSVKEAAAGRDTLLEVSKVKLEVFKERLDKIDVKLDAIWEVLTKCP